ncbi:MAG TPA: EAL domain-containing protein, partial [Methylophilaceae bacterium]|nr:EAL domain-containing protein [Methylophilaceae bacterium]
ELEDFGVTVSIDDFGSGYSSLSYLRKFAATELKIDRTFIEEITHNSEAKELLRSIILMGHALGMTVVAEGVEDEHSASLLEELDCDIVQGYFFARPQEPQHIEALVAEMAS